MKKGFLVGWLLVLNGCAVNDPSVAEYPCGDRCKHDYASCEKHVSASAKQEKRDRVAKTTVVSGVVAALVQNNVAGLVDGLFDGGWASLSDKELIESVALCMRSKGYTGQGESGYESGGG